jgi:hypothetical protein
MNHGLARMRGAVALSGSKVFALSALKAFTWFCEEVNMSVLYFRFHPSTISVSRAGPKSMNRGAPSIAIDLALL